MDDSSNGQHGAAASPVAAAADRLIAEYEKVLAPINLIIAAIERVRQLEFPERMTAEIARQLNNQAHETQREFRKGIAKLTVGAAHFARFEEWMRQAAGAPRG